MMALTASEAATGQSPTQAERDWRWGRVRQLMDARGLDGLLVFGSRDRPFADHYLTNERCGLTVVFPREGEIAAVGGMGPITNYAGSYLVSAERGEDTWLADVRFGPGVPTIMQVLGDRGLVGKKLGTVGTGYAGVLQPGGWLGYGMWNAMSKALEGSEIVDVTWDYLVLMLEKSAWDVAHVRRAAAAGEAACQAMVAACRPGASEADVFAEGMYALHKRGIRATWMILQSGHNNIGWTEAVWQTRDQEPRRLEAGDTLEAELFPHYATQEAQLQLCVALGDLSPEHERCAQVARQAYEVGLRVLKPGITFADLCAAMEQPVRALGGWHLTPMVHSLNPLICVSSFGRGIGEHVPAFARRFPGVDGRDITGADVVIRPGMTFAFEPNAHLGRTRINVGGTIVVTEAGCEELNQYTNRLIRVAANG
jgi:Xaa-Pro aminopeptidase